MHKYKINRLIVIIIEYYNVSDILSLYFNILYKKIRYYWHFFCTYLIALENPYKE